MKGCVCVISYQFDTGTVIQVSLFFIYFLPGNDDDFSVSTFYSVIILSIIQLFCFFLIHLCHHDIRKQTQFLWGNL